MYKLTARQRNIGGMLGTKNQAMILNEKIHFSAKDRFEHATEIEYKKKHIGRSLGRALISNTPPVANILKGERDCHRKLTQNLLNDGGGTPAAIYV